MDSGIFFQQKVISNLVVTDEIFRYLTKADLINCSMVSKACVPHIRQYLLRHYSLLLRLDLSQTGRLDEALEMLENSLAILYNGVYLGLSSQSFLNSEGFHNTFEPRKPILENIFAKIQTFKFVTLGPGICYKPGWRRLPRFCLDLLPAAEIEKLKMHDDLGADWTFALDLFGHGLEFSALKVLDIHIQVNSFRNLTKLLETFPVLEEWSSAVKTFELPHFIQARKDFIIKSMEYGKSIEPEYLQSINLAQVVLRRLEVFLDPNPIYIDLIWNLLRTSISSLQDVELRFGFFWPFIQSGTAAPLNNVKTLVVRKKYNLDIFDDNYDSDEDMEVKVLQDVDTRRIFPHADIQYVENFRPPSETSSDDDYYDDDESDE